MKVIALSCREAVLPSQEPASHLSCEGECQTQRAVPIFAPRFKDCVQGCLSLTRASSNPPACRGIAVTCHKKRSPDGLLAFRFHLPESGRAGEIRTHDLLHPMQAFYQAELQPAIRFGLFGGTAVWRVVKRIQVPDAFFPKHSAGTSWNGVGRASSLLSGGWTWPANVQFSAVLKHLSDPPPPYPISCTRLSHRNSGPMPTLHP